MEVYEVKPLPPSGEAVIVSVPASKSILNRALILAAFLRGTTHLRCGSFGEDTRTLLDCLVSLGIRVDETPQGFTVYGGTHRKHASIYVGSSGTAARFLTAMLAFCGGDYEIGASEQMEQRPMAELTEALHQVGVHFEYQKEAGKLPFLLHSDGISANELTINTDVSTQFASGLLLAAATSPAPFTLHLTGSRINSSYIRMTVELLKAFGADVKTDSNAITVNPIIPEGLEHVYEVEPDISGACYFYALSLLAHKKVLVRGVHFETLQGDIRFLTLLSERGVVLNDTPEGIWADGSFVTEFEGFDVDLQDFSDQTLTVAALAPFAYTPSRLRGISHIRSQECNRVAAIVENLTALGVPCFTDKDEIVISPATVKGGRIRTYNDHRVAMAFALIGLVTDGISIEHPACTKKTFENYFSVLDELTAH